MIRRPRDTDQLAKLMVDMATGQVKDGPPEQAGRALAAMWGQKA